MTTKAELLAMTRIVETMRYVEHALVALDAACGPAAGEARQVLELALLELGELYAAASAAVEPVRESHGERRTGGVR